MNQELKRFARAVHAMRAAQRRYFEDRSQSNIRESIANERHVDDILRYLAETESAIEVAQIAPPRPVNQQDAENS